MPKLWNVLTTRKQKELRDWYQQQFGKKFCPPVSEKQAVSCELNIETVEEIDKIMRQKPQGRMGRG